MTLTDNIINASICKLRWHIFYNNIDCKLTSTDFNLYLTTTTTKNEEETKKGFKWKTETEVLVYNFHCITLSL